jgi:hypothetical protein
MNTFTLSILKLADTTECKREAMVIYEPTVRPMDGSVELHGRLWFKSNALRVGDPFLYEKSHGEPVGQNFSSLLCAPMVRVTSYSYQQEGPYRLERHIPAP